MDFIVNNFLVWLVLSVVLLTAAVFMQYKNVESFLEVKKLKPLQIAVTSLLTCLSAIGMLLFVVGAVAQIVR